MRHQDIFKLFLATKSDMFSEFLLHFQLHLWKQNGTFVMRGQDIFGQDFWTFSSHVSGNKTRYFWLDIRTFFGKMWGHFPAMFLRQNQIVLMRCQDIFSPVSGNKTGCFWRDIETLTVVFVATKSNILNKMSEYFPAVITKLKNVLNEKSFSSCLWRQNQTFWWDVGTFLAEFVATQSDIFGEPCLWRQMTDVKTF